MTKEIMEKAHELGQMITQTKEFKEIKDKQHAMFSDPGALDLLRKFDEIKNVQKAKRAKGEQLTDDDITVLEEMEAKMNENPRIKAFFEAQSDFQELLNTTMDTIVKPCREF